MVNASNLGMDPQTIRPLQPGSTSVFDSAQRMGTQNQNQLSCLNGNCAKGGMRSKKGKKSKRLRGGQLIVPTVNTNGVNDGGASQANVTRITGATVVGNVQGVYDACVGQGSSCTAQVALNQKSLLTGGRIKTRRIKTRSFKSRNFKSRKHRRTNKYKKHSRRHYQN